MKTRLQITFLLSLSPLLLLANQLSIQVDSLAHSKHVVTKRVNGNKLKARISTKHEMVNIKVSADCESWYLSTENSTSAPPRTLNSLGSIVLTDELVHSGLCFCENCANSISTRTLRQSAVYFHGEKCKGSLKIKGEKYIDPSLPIWTQVQPSKGTSISLNNILFRPNQSKIVKSSAEDLNHLLQMMTNFPSLKITIIGHVNGPGMENTQEFKDLSLNRAKEVMKFLNGKGISVQRVEAQGKGNLEMLYPKANTDLQMKKNRRVEILIKE